MANLEHWRLDEWLDRCIELGYDMKVPHEVTNFFYAQSHEVALGLAEALHQVGHRILARGELRELETGEIWMVKTEIVARLDQASMEAMIALCETMAQAKDAIYDGWEVGRP